MNVTAMSIAGANLVTAPEHRSIELGDYSRLRAELDAPGRRGLVDPFTDLDRQLLDDLMARSLVDARSRSRPRRREVKAMAGVLAALLPIAWLT